MAYSDLANNQCISFNSLISGANQGYFSPKTTIPSSNEMATKADCNTYVTVNPLYPPFAAKSNDQLVTKQDLKNNICEIYISNNFFIGTITNVTVNGVSITGASFPLDIGNGTTGYTTQVGTYDILVYYADATNPSNYIRIEDSNYKKTCVDGFSSLGPGPYYVTLPSQILNTSVTVNIVSGDGQCLAPPPTLIANLPFSTVAVSRGTGQYMLAGNANIGNPFIEGSLFRSTDYGATWTLASQFGYWNKVAISDNGQYMLAVEYYGRAYKSSDYGNTWNPINNFPYPDNNPYGLPVLQTLNFRGAALSGDGKYQVISTSQNYYGRVILNDSKIDSWYTTIFVSDDYGDTWHVRRNDTAGTYEAVAISASGQTVLAAAGTIFLGQGSILRSTNYGVNWSSASPSLPGNLVDVAITADGNYAIAARFSNDIVEFSPVPYLLSSSDGGASWYDATFGEANKNWMRVAINRIGTNFATAWALPNTNFPTPGPVYIYEVSIYLNYILQWEDQPGAKLYKSIANSDNGLHILAGAKNGLFRSNDGGFTWTAIQSVG